MTPTDLSPLLEFDEVEPEEDCICGGCGARRRARQHAAPRGIRRHAAVLVAAVGTAIAGGTAAAAAPTPDNNSTTQTPQGEISGPYGQGDRASTAQPLTRAQIIQRAQSWVDQSVPYSMGRYWSDGYRQDCSGFVSMAWGLGSSQTTWTLPDFAERIGKNDLQPGDVLLFNNPASPQAGSHVTIFGGWTDSSRTRYLAYEQTAPGARKRATPYAYWNNSGAYVPYRYTGLSGASNDGGVPATAFPGPQYFGPGQDNAYVTTLGRMLVQRGGSRFYTEGPGPRWGEADRKATQAFQLAQGWRGAEADGLPGKDTWDYLVHGKGRNIDSGTPLPPPPPTTTPPPFPGTQYFAPGQDNDHVRRLGDRLVQKGFGGSYTVGPGPRWTEADRQATEAFQLAQGWQGPEADGYPGPDTWRHLFS
ncbi:peptidoglycan-binding protein [Kitasatospora sp. NPDC093550]|uniref:peptidoglycan-binding protein n=1 Tax=Kitasatospora sp. NPDC093550 TaxID=3364089 RepID=UPI0037F765A0